MGVARDVNAWYKVELAGDYRQNCIVLLAMLNEVEVYVEHVVPRFMETGDLADLKHWLYDANLKEVVYAGFKFTPKTPPPFGLKVTEED
jgi:hypothetical protein